jgi:hypothetical protein
VNCNRLHANPFRCACELDRRRVALVPPSAHLDGNWDRHAFDDGFDHAGRGANVLEQRCTCSTFGDFGHPAAHVDVNHRRAIRDHHARSFRHDLRISAEQLH